MKQELPRNPLRVLGVVGSLREKSFNRALLNAAIDLAPDGMEIQAFQRLAEIPPFNEDLETKGDPEPVQALKKAIEEADALLVVTPEYNFGVPGVLKNAIDWASRPPKKSVLNGKAAGIMGGTPGTIGTSRAQLGLRQAFQFTETHALLQPEILISRIDKKMDPFGKLTDPVTIDYVRKYLVALAAWTAQIRQRNERGAEPKVA